MNKAVYLSPKEYAEKFKTSHRHVLDLARKGMLKGFKVGHLWRLEDTPPIQKQRKEIGTEQPEDAFDF